MNAFRRTLRYLTKYWPRFLAVLGGILASNVLTVVTPLFVKTIFDEVLPQLNYEALAFYSLAVVGATVLGSAFSYVLRYINEYISQKSVYDIRNDLYQSLLSQSFSFYDRTRTGQLMARAIGDINQLRAFFRWGLRALIDTVLRFVFAFSILLWIDWKLTILFFVSAPLISLTIRRYANKIGPMWEAIRSRYGNLNAVVQENLMGVRVVKGFAAEAQEIEKFSNENREYMETVVDQARLSAFYRPLATFIANVTLFFILGYGGYLVIGGNLTFGAWITFNLYAWQLLWPVRFLGFITSFYKRAMAAASRVFEIMDLKPEVKENEEAFELETVAGYVKFENVYFGYENNQRVLDNINFEVKPGETVAILGATGSGKSSIINLIPRFYDVTAGKITVDNHDIRDVTLASLRRNIAIVQQEPFIFSTDFKENIAYGKEDVSMAEIFRVAKAAQLDAFISSLANGYDTKVGERGVTLSGGQKQRVAIARALLTDPKIVIFDASTSSVDMETEHEIQKALESLLPDRTTFIITQRLSTVKHVDKIVILDEGKIVEMGTHQELIAKKGWYYRLYQTQFQDQTDMKNRATSQEEA